MKSFVGFVFALAAYGSAVTPIEKVLELLGGMLEKSKSSSHEEAVQWAAYKQFCSDSEQEKQELVKRADEQIDVLKGSIEKHGADIERLGQEVEGHQSDIVSFEADRTNATGTRGTEHTDYEALYKDYSESITAIKEATKMLKAQQHNRPQAAALLAQVMAMQRVPPAARRAIDSFIAQDPESQDLSLVQPPEAQAYESQSGNIVGLLDELLEKFTDERTDLEKTEMTNRHSYEMLAQDLRNSEKAATEQIAKKTKAGMASKQDLADSSTKLDEVMSTRKADQQYLDDLATTCSKKMDDFGSRQELRANEIDALEKAVALLSSDKVAGAGKKHLPTMAQVTRATALAHLRSDPASSSSVRLEQVATYLQQASSRIGSGVLARVALQAQEDPFVKVKKLIGELIARLQEEATEEADHKSWCDDELSTNAQTRTSKTAEVETLHATVDSLTSEIAMDKKDIASLSKAVAELKDAVAKATKLHTAEKAQQENTIADSVAGQEGVSEAISILKDFYDGAATATALVQAPPIFDAAYKGQQTEGKNVLAFLDVIRSDFARLEQETSDAMNLADSEYATFMSDSAADEKAKNTDIATKQDSLQTNEQDLFDTQNDLEATQGQLDAALTYYDKLKPSCLITSSDSSYSERVDRRTQEVQSLKEALSILNGETLSGSGPEALYSSVDGGNVGLDTGIQAGEKKD